jgi:hypothetical protein
MKDDIKNDVRNPAKDSKGDPLLMEIQEELNRENMVKFFSQFGGVLFVLAIILLIAVAGYQYWRQDQIKDAKKAGTEVYNILRSADKPQDEFSLKKLDETSHSKGYYEISLLNKAQIQIKNNDIPGAIKSFDAVSKNTDADKGLRDLAGLNAANLLLNANPKAEGLEQRLVGLTADDNSFKYNAMELLASFYIQNGNQEKANEVLDKLVKSANVPVTIAKRAKELSPPAAEPQNEEE